MFANITAGPQTGTLTQPTLAASPFSSERRQSQPHRTPSAAEYKDISPFICQMHPHQTAEVHVCSRSLSAEPAQLLRGGAVWIPVVPDTYKPSRFGKICFSFAELNMFSSLSCTSELHVLRCKLPSENPSILNSSAVLRQGNHLLH